MAKNLETGWLCVGRSGDTIDGRIISEQDVLDAAEFYDPKFYTAVIWPEHKRWFSLGKVTKVKSEKNTEGGVDLFAKLQPNDYYLQMNAAGQRLFTSMELPPNFRKTGKAYLYGLGATDQPASIATSEVIFSDLKSRKDVDVEVDALLISQYTKHPINIDVQDLNDEEPGWFKRFKKKHFSNNDSEADMKKEDFEKFEAQLKELTDKVNKFTAAEKQGAESEETEEQNFSDLSKKVTDLTERFAAIEKTVVDKDKGDGAEEHYANLKSALEDLTKKFNAALEESGGTAAGEDTGGEDLNAYV